MVGMELFVIICLAVTVYIIINSVKKAKIIDKQNNQQKNAAKSNKGKLEIMIHLDGGDDYDVGKSFKVIKDQKLYDYTDESGCKVLMHEWDYDFWQITSNKSSHAFEWTREDHNFDNASTLNFWEGGNLSDVKVDISEDTAIDIIMDSNWIPGLDALLLKNKKPLEEKSNTKLKDKREMIKELVDLEVKSQNKNRDSRSKGIGNL